MSNRQLITKQTSHMTRNSGPTLILTEISVIDDVISFTKCIPELSQLMKPIQQINIRTRECLSEITYYIMQDS